MSEPEVKTCNTCRWADTEDGRHPPRLWTCDRPGAPIDLVTGGSELLCVDERRGDDADGRWCGASGRFHETEPF